MYVKNILSSFVGLSLIGVLTGATLDNSESEATATKKEQTQSSTENISLSSVSEQDKQLDADKLKVPYKTKVFYLEIDSESGVAAKPYNGPGDKQESVTKVESSLYISSGIELWQGAGIQQGAVGQGFSRGGVVVVKSKILSDIVGIDFKKNTFKSNEAVKVAEKLFEVSDTYSVTIPKADIKGEAGKRSMCWGYQKFMAYNIYSSSDNGIGQKYQYTLFIPLFDMAESSDERVAETISFVRYQE